MTTLSERVHVARRFQRSIRIDVDLNDAAALEGFVCPSSSADVLETMARHVGATGQAAFTWTGPYGSGKSSLVVALSAALSPKPKVREAAAKALGRSVAGTLWRSLMPKGKGWRVLPVVGQRAAPATVIGESLVANKLARGNRTKPWTDDRIIDALMTAASETPRQHGGLIVFLDEMGKFLEGASQDGHDVHIFQRLAEQAARSNGRLIIVGILHQAFDEYAQRLARDRRDEWSKVQGRFVDLVVNAAGDEQLELLSRAIQHDRKKTKPSALTLSVATASRSGRKVEAKELALTLQACWPLHPVVACLLGPISRRRFGQNQRSLFGFLNSAEPFGFQDFLRNASDEHLFEPTRLWDYLRTNLEPAILASPDGHRWSMAVEAVERCEVLGGSEAHLRALKSIALLDLFRERSGLAATPDVIASCIGAHASSADFLGTLKQLESWSFVMFRKHLGAYAIFAGSDFDIEGALRSAMEDLREIDLRELRSLAGLQPVVAKRHYHDTGALRWFPVDIAELRSVGATEFVPSGSVGELGRFVLVFPTENEPKAIAASLCQHAAERFPNRLVVGLSAASWQIKPLAREFFALSKIYEERPELAGDSVARREVIARRAEVRSRLEAELQKLFDTADWYRAGAKPKHYTHAELNALASHLADEAFAQSPLLPNELLNREEPSSNANAAQRGLLRLMVQAEGEPRLGIESFPAEGGLFDSILLKARLYRFSPQGWRFQEPSEEDDPCRLLPAWNAATRHLEANTARPLTVAELYAIWREPPFGIKAGLLPLIAVAFLLARRDRLAFYREGVFQARFTDLDVDYLTKDPACIQLRWMDLSDVSRRILSGLASVVRDLDGKNELAHLAPIDVARGLVAIHDGLRPWVKRTSRLSANALKIRGLFKQASDPNKFLFDDIPALFASDTSDNKSVAVEAAVERVRQGLQELSSAYGEMLARLRHMMLTELHVPNLSPQALAELRSRAENVLQLTGDFRLNAFVGRLTQFAGTDEDMEGIASLAMNKPSRDWVDADVDQGAIEVADLAQKFIRSEAYARVKGRSDKRHAMAVVVGMDGRPTPVSGEFAIADTDRAAVDDVIARVEEALFSADRRNRSVILAALAEMSAKFLSEDAEDGKPVLTLRRG